MARRIAKMLKLQFLPVFLTRIGLTLLEAFKIIHEREFDTEIVDLAAVDEIYFDYICHSNNIYHQQG